jgi:flagellar motor switch protein FliN/FliY
MTKLAVSSLDLPEAPSAAPSGASLVSRDIGLVGHVAVQLSAIVGTAQLSIDELFALKRGDVVTLDASVDDPITLLLNGKAIARGELVAVEECFGVRITELL